MKIQLLLLMLAWSASCAGQSESTHSIKEAVSQNESGFKGSSIQHPPRIQHLAELSKVAASDTYESTKKKVEAQRLQLQFSDCTMDSISQYFKEALLNHIIPFWEGTAWSFEGHTAQPRSGAIACGYFVSTTLKDIGLNLNRYRLAQQSPIHEAKSLALSTAVKEISEESITANMEAIRQHLKEGIHFIGFDQSHVGYILKERNVLYLIHSNYIGAVGVEIEPIESSEVFRSYDRFYLVELSTNEALLHHWMIQKKLPIITE